MKRLKTFLLVMAVAANVNLTQAGKDTIKVDPAEQAAYQMASKNGYASVESEHVVEVNIYGNNVTDAEVKLLPALSKVRKIQITSSKITGAGMKELAGLKNLTELGIHQNAIVDDNLKEIAALKQVRILKLQATKITGAGLSELAPLTELEHLTVGQNFKIGDNAGIHIAANLKKLKHLSIDNSGIGDVGLLALTELPQLEVLIINGTRVTNKGYAALPKFKNLKELMISFFDVNDDTAKTLAECKSLERLRLFNTAITAKGLNQLGTLPNLRHLALGGTRIDPAGVTAFIKAHPKVNLLP